MSNIKQSICIFLNSATANSYINNYTSECMFVLPTINIPKKSKVSISVQSASIPYSFYNVDDFNSKIVYVENSITYTKYIPQGNYNVNTLANALKTLMPNFTITYSSLDNSFLFTNSIYDFQILSSSLCYEILGFKPGQSYSSINKILKSNISINLFTIRNIYISSNNLILNNVNSSTPNNSSILCSIPIMSSQGSIISYSNIYDVKNEVYHTNNLNLLHIKLTDQDCDILDLNGVHWSMTLQLDITK